MVPHKFLEEHHCMSSYTGHSHRKQDLLHSQTCCRTLQVIRSLRQKGSISPILTTFSWILNSSNRVSISFACCLAQLNRHSCWAALYLDIVDQGPTINIIWVASQKVPSRCARVWCCGGYRRKSGRGRRCSSTGRDSEQCNNVRIYIDVVSSMGKWNSVLSNHVHYTDSSHIIYVNIAQAAFDTENIVLASLWSASASNSASFCLLVAIIFMWSRITYLQCRRYWWKRSKILQHIQGYSANWGSASPKLQRTALIDLHKRRQSLDHSTKKQRRMVLAG